MAMIEESARGVPLTADNPSAFLAVRRGLRLL
jgi:hypothetical protein